MWRRAATAVGVGLLAFLTGIAAESVILRAIHRNRRELEWLSDAALSMVPAGRIGGDFYDFFQPQGDTALAILADVSGKGIPAALILSSLKMLFRTIARETLDPAAIAERISAALYEELAGLPYATAIVARFETGRLVYVNAGHPAGCLLRNGAVTAALESGGRPLGLLPESRYATSELELRPGDIGVLVTDGITEALETGPVTPSQAVEAAGCSTAAGSPAEICDALLEAAANGPGPAGAPDWQDDRTVFVFAVEPAV